MHIITSVAKDKKGNIAQVMLKSGSIMTVAEATEFIANGSSFIAEDAAGNQAAVSVAKESLRSKKNKIVSDNLDNLPLFEVSYE